MDEERCCSATTVMPAKAGIQYAAAHRFNQRRLGILDRPVKPGDPAEFAAASMRLADASMAHVT
uniref:hypothetical protein n=1 Tax=Bradyrhizobium sp. (strain ORS 278) TaxID=114615 RepID=UPI0005A1A46C|nr:hypothetical protein [Bradyrhizobium sp. ORS 278]